MTFSINKDCVYAPSRNAAFRRIADEVVIVDTLAGKMISLNETGSAIWALLGAKTVDQIADELTVRFEVRREMALEEITVFLQTLGDRGLLDINGPAAGTTFP